MNDFIQFELWKDCHNGCKFCFNKGQPDVDKLTSMNFVKKKLLEEETNRYNEIGFIGGEFFDGQLKDENVKKEFYSLFDICSEKRKQGKLDKLYVCTSLIFNINDYLKEFIEYLDSINLLDITLLCTSYDSKYRFKTVEDEELWKSNMLLLNDSYPKLRLHTEIIVTQFFINDVLEDRFNLREFREKYHTSTDFIEPASGFYYINKEEMTKVLPDFFPIKSSFIKFLHKVATGNDDIELYKFLSMNTRSNTMYYIVDGQRFVIKDRRSGNLKFQGTKNGAKYEIGFIDSKQKMSEIVEQLLRIRG